MLKIIPNISPIHNMSPSQGSYEGSKSQLLTHPRWCLQVKGELGGTLATDFHQLSYRFVPLIVFLIIMETLGSFLQMNGFSGNLCSSLS